MNLTMTPQSWYGQVLTPNTWACNFSWNDILEGVMNTYHSGVQINPDILVSLCKETQMNRHGNAHKERAEGKGRGEKQ